MWEWQQFVRFYSCAFCDYRGTPPPCLCTAPEDMPTCLSLAYYHFHYTVPPAAPPGVVYSPPPLPPNLYAPPPARLPTQAMAALSLSSFNILANLLRLLLWLFVGNSFFRLSALQSRLQRSFSELWSEGEEEAGEREMMPQEADGEMGLAELVVTQRQQLEQERGQWQQERVQLEGLLLQLREENVALRQQVQQLQQLQQLKSVK